MCWTIWVSSSSPFDMVQESRSPSKLGTRKRRVQECWLKRNTPPPICRKDWTMYLKWSSPSRWRFKRGPRLSPPLGVGVGIGWWPPSSLAKVWPRPKNRPVPDHCCSPLPSNKHRESVRHQGYRPESKWCVSTCVFVWVVKGHAKVCAHLKALTQTWVNTERTTSRVLHFELMRLLNVLVCKHVTHECVERSSRSGWLFYSYVDFLSFIFVIDVIFVPLLEMFYQDFADRSSG